MSNNTRKEVQVALSKGQSPRENIAEGIKKLGGIKSFIDQGDNVFIKFSLNLPSGYPTNTNFDVLEEIIEQCDEAGAKKISIGAFPYKGFSIKSISDVLGLEDYVKALGAELVYLDNSNYFSSKKPDLELLKNAKSRMLTSVQVNNKKYPYPKIVLDSDKLISVNQVNVDPLFRITSALLNSYSLVPNSVQQLNGKAMDLDKQEYKKFLISSILDVFSIKEPSLVINDLFYVLEGAGPYIYKDSKLKKTGWTVVGTNAVSVDYLTTKVLNLDILPDSLLEKAQKRKLGPMDLGKITLKGQIPKESSFNLSLCPKNLNDINLLKFHVKEGKCCAGCYKQAFHLLNLMKTNMIKDLKYLNENDFLLGNEPPEPDLDKDILIFGDCAINSTKKLGFRTIKTETISKKGKKKIKIKTNEHIKEFPGCPPDINESTEGLIEFFGKGNVPTLYLFQEMLKIHSYQRDKTNLDIWEEL